MPNLMKLLMFFAFCTLSTNNVFAVEYLSYKTKGKLKFTSRVHDFGVVKRGQKLQADFDFENVGKGPILIQGVHAACGCTAVQADSGKVYEPGETGQIKVVFDSSDFSGKVAKVITVMTNEAALPARSLTLKATITSDLEASPPLADFGNVTVGGSPTIQIKLLNHSSNPVMISRIDYDKDIVEAGYVRNGSGWIVNLKLNSRLPTGFVREKVVLKNSSDLQSEYIIPIRANVLGHIEQEPRYIEFGALAGGKTIERVITLNGDETIKVGNPTIDLSINGKKQRDSKDYVSVQLLDSKKGKRIFKVKLKGRDGVKGSVHGRVIFEIDSREQKELPIDLYGIFL